jgi:hypothetical protein
MVAKTLIFGTGGLTFVTLPLPVSVFTTVFVAVV